MRNDIYTTGIETRFSKDRQPSNESKRVPKFKAQLKRELLKNFPTIVDTIMSKCNEGDIRHIEFVRDWLYGKVTEKQEIKHEGDLIIKVELVE